MDLDGMWHIGHILIKSMYRTLSADYEFSVLCYTVMTLNFRTDRSWQADQTARTRPRRAFILILLKSVNNFHLESHDTRLKMSHDMTKPTKWVLAVRKKKPWVLSYPFSTQRRLIRLGGCPGWSESSLGAHSFCWFCHVVAQILSQQGIAETVFHSCRCKIFDSTNKIAK